MQHTRTDSKVHLSQKFLTLNCDEPQKGGRMAARLFSQEVKENDALSVLLL